MRPTRSILCLVAVSSVTTLSMPAGLSARIRPQSTADSEVRLVVDRFVLAFQRGDLPGLISCWSEKSPDVATAKRSFQNTFASVKEIKASVFDAKSEVNGDQATVRLDLDMSAVNATTGKPAEGFGKIKRIIYLVKETGAWKIWRYVSLEQDLARRIAEAKTDEERRSVLNENKDLFTRDLDKALLEEADRLRTAGSFSQALSVFSVAENQATQMNDEASVAEALLGLSGCSFLQGKYEPSLEYAQKAVDVSKAADSKRVMARALSALGRGYRQLGKYDEAAKNYGAALQAGKTTGDRAATAEALSGLGTVEERRGDYSAALEDYRESAKIGEEIGDKATTARALGNAANVQVRRGNKAEALEAYLKVYDIFEQIGNKPAAGGTLLNIGRIEEEQADYPKAIQHFQRGLAIGHEIGDRHMVWIALNNLGTLEYARGDGLRAKQYYKDALEMCRSLGDQAAIAMTSCNLGFAEEKLGDYPAALKDYQDALQIDLKIGNKSQSADALSGIADIEFLKGNLNAALQGYQSSLEISNEIGDRIQIVKELGNIGAIHSDLGNFSRALEYQEKSQKLMEEMGDKAGLALVLDNIGLIRFELHQPDLAEECYQKSLVISRELGNRSRSAYTLNDLGMLKWLEGDYAKALAYYQESLETIHQIGDDAQIADVLANMGVTYNSLEKPTEAIQLELQAIASSNKSADPNLAIKALNTLGDAYRKSGKTDQARQAFLDAISAVERLRSQAAVPLEQGQNFFYNRISPYQGMVSLCVAQDKPADALIAAERYRSRAVIDSLRSGKIDITKEMTAEERNEEKRLASNLASLNAQAAKEKPREDTQKADDLTQDLKQARLDYEGFQTRLYAAHPDLKIKRAEFQPISIDQCADLLPDSNAALLEYVISQDTTYLFVLTRGHSPDKHVQVKVYDLRAKEQDLSKLAEHFRESLAARSLTYSDLAAQIYNLLLRPATADLAGKNSLIIVPDGVLWELPFQALQSAPDHFLLQDHAISYAPSLTALREMSRHTHGKRGAASDPSLLALGNAMVGKEASSRIKAAFMDAALEPIPEAETQVRMLGQLYARHRSRIYLGPDATEDRLKADASGFRILHLAAHGILNDASPMYSQIILSRAQGSDDDGILEAWEVANMDLKADLVVLSACDTARGRVASGEGMIGLTWAFFVAGVPATVVSQWSVDSEGTSALMVQFHRNLLAGMTKAEALRRAELKLSRDPRYNHPFYWAPFVVVGDPN